MSYVFVDRRCPRCNGKGTSPDTYNVYKPCRECNGTGMIGSFEEVPDLPRKEPSEFAKMLRKTRERRMVSMSELADLLKVGVTRISDIERGVAEPTEKEKEKLEMWINE